MSELRPSLVVYSETNGSRAQPSDMKRCRSAGNVNESPSRRFESPRSHAELHELGNNGMNDTNERDMNIDTPPRRRRSRPTNYRSQESLTRRSARSSSLQPNSTGSGGNHWSSSRSRPTSSASTLPKLPPVKGAFRRQTPQRGRSKTQSLLDRLNRPRETKKDASPVVLATMQVEGNGTSDGRRASRRSTRSPNQVSRASTPQGTRPNRISVRVVRVQQKAATIIQAICRRFLARSSYRRNLLQKRYLQYVEEKRERETSFVRESAELLAIKLVALERQTQNEIDIMQTKHDDEKRRLEASLRESFATKLHDFGTDDQSEENTVQFNEERKRLKNEQDQMISEISLLEGLMPDLERESDDLQATNQNVMDMFTALNQFARASVAEKKRFEAEAQVYNKVEVNKVRHDLKICSSAVIVESAAKNMYRGSMYRHVYNNVKSLHDRELFEKSMGLIRECEESLGNRVLPPEEAKTLLERRDSDDDSDDD